MKTKREHIVTYVRSCLDNQIVWAYFGTSEEGARKAYWRATKEEVRRMRQWPQRMAERKRRLLHLLDGNGGCLNSGISRRTLTCVQRKAVKEIMQLVRNQPPKDTDFYGHILEEARLRNSQTSRWKEKREKLFRYGKYHTASDYVPTEKPRGGDHKSAAYKMAKAGVGKENISCGD